MNDLTNITNLIKFCDVTQREGRQALGFHLSPAESIEHAQIIDRLGIEFIELNHPASSSVLGNIIKDVAKLDLTKTKILTHVRCNVRDVQAAISTGVDGVNTYIPINPYSEKEITNSINNALDELREIARLTNQENIELRVSLEHAFALPLDILKETFRKITDIQGVVRVGMADTTGTCFPDKARQYVQTVFEVIPENMPIQIHLHNDHGLAAANFWEISRLLNEIQRQAIFDISLGGFGERNGILSFGDVFSVLYLINPKILKHKYNIAVYAKLLKFLEGVTDVSLPQRDPLNPAAFSHSAGPHLKGMMANQRYQKISPRAFGLNSRLNIGHCTTGWQGVQSWIQKHLHKKIDPSSAKKIAARIREHASNHGPIDDNKLSKFISILL